MRVLITFSLFGLALGSYTYPPRNLGTLRNSASCGNIPNFMIGDRIVGGVDAASPIPWQVSIRHPNHGHICGGTILDEKTIMSAAHCFDKNQNMNGWKIRAGVTKRTDDSGQTIGIANGVWNSAKPYQGNNNDFIILKLKSALEFNENVGPACLPEPGYAPETNGQTCFVSGWGTLKSGANNLPKKLQWVAVPTVTNEKCGQSYSGITSSMICAGHPEGGKDSCQGDSGGPFICRKDGKAILTGVVSFGIGCAEAEYPGVYARVTAVLNWVKAEMEGGSGSPPTAPPTASTTAPPPANGCGSPHWVGDMICDDDNNNAECNFDDGDCCHNDAPGWDTYCDACECKDPNAESPECKDNWNATKCERKKDNGKCDRKRVAKNCQETCGFC